jgi:hypothetical protein
LTQSEKNNYKEKSRSEFMAQRDAMKSHGLPTWRMQNATAVSAVPAIHATCGRAGPGAPQIWEDHGGEGSYGTVLKGLMPYGRFCVLKIFKGSKAMISLKQEGLIFKKECGNSFLPCWKSNADRSRSPTWLWSLLGQACPKCSSIMVLSLEVQCSA